MIGKFQRITRSTQLPISVGFLVLYAVTSLTVALLYNTSETASAATGSNFNAGRIIDDTVFYNNKSMTSTQVQSFLNSKVPICDTNGTKISEHGGSDLNGDGKVQRWEWGKKYYNQTKFTCLKDYRQNTPAMEAASGLCGGITAKSSRTAAQIISDVANACRINPQVLVVLLQKEQSLVTDTWPLTIQYKSATGFDCPDTAPCDPQYAGFFYQVYHAARQFKVYKAYPNDYNYLAGRTNRIYWHPDLSRCGSSQVYIENQATAALYIYTPYRPNSAALSNLYGTGNSCSSYGNRNFWRMFTDWFGSTLDKTVQITRSMYFSPGTDTVSTADTVAVSFVVKNVSKTTQTLESIGVAVRDQNNAVHNFPFKKVTLQPGQSYEYYQYGNFGAPGKYRMWIANLLPGGTWSSTWPNSIRSSIIRQKSVTVTEAPDISISRSMYYSPTSNPTNASTEDQTAASFRVINNDTKSVTIPEMRVAARHGSGSLTYYPSAKSVSLTPGQEYEYYKYTNLPKVGTHTLSIQIKSPSGQWSSSWPPSVRDTIVRQMDVNIVAPPNVKISRDLYVSPNPVLVGQQIGSSFIVKNNEATPVTIKELRVRAVNSKGSTLDFPAVTNISLDPGEEYTYYQYRTFYTVDKYTFYPVAKVSTPRITSTWPAPNSGIVTKRSLSSRLPNITLVRKLYHSPSDHKPVVGQTNAVSFIIKNNEDRPVVLPPMGVAVRDGKNNVVNFPFVRDITLGAGKTYEYYQSRSFSTKGNYRMWIATGLPWGGWSSSWPKGSPSTLIRSKTITVY